MIETEQVWAAPLGAAVEAADAAARDALLATRIEEYKGNGFQVQEVVDASEPAGQNGESSPRPGLADAYTAALGKAGAACNVVVLPAPRGGQAVLYHPNNRPSGVAYLHARRGLSAY